jgi:hypothetical protein
MTGERTAHAATAAVLRCLSDRALVCLRDTHAHTHPVRHDLLTLIRAEIARRRTP